MFGKKKVPRSEYTQIGAFNTYGCDCGSPGTIAHSPTCSYLKALETMRKLRAEGFDYEPIEVEFTNSASVRYWYNDKHHLRMTQIHYPGAQK